MDQEEEEEEEEGKALWEGAQWGQVQELSPAIHSSFIHLPTQCLVPGPEGGDLDGELSETDLVALLQSLHSGMEANMPLQ